MTDDHDFMFDEPERDKKGRFRKGTSGNPRGRPPAPPSKPRPLANCIAEMLSKEVVVNDNGTEKTLAFRELLAEKLVRAAVHAKPKELIQIMQQLEKIAAQAILEEEEYAPIYTDEDRRILEIINREVDENYYCNCERCDLPIKTENPNRNW